jgi:hypothetical protein
VSWRMKRSRWHRMEDVGYAFEKAHPQLLTISHKRDEVSSKYTFPTLLISLPIKPIIQPVIEKTKQVWIYNPVIRRQISKEAAETRVVFVQYLTNSLNSAAFCLLVYLICRSSKQGAIRRGARGVTAEEPRGKPLT